MAPEEPSSPSEPSPPDPLMRGMTIGTLVCIAGCALLIGLQGAPLVTATGIALGGIAFVGALAIAFYAIGRGEDRERAARESGPNGPTD